MKNFTFAGILNRRQIQLVFLTIFVTVMATSILNPQVRSGIAVDFSCFRMVGTIVSEGAGSRLYDSEYQAEMYRRLGTDPGRGNALPFVGPPVIAVAAVPLSRLPLMTGFFIWAAVSTALYSVGIWLVADRRTFGVALPIALAFQPFAVDTLLTGQLSAVIFIGVALAIRLDRSDRPLSAGAALALCAIKPPAMLWILPMLLLTRRYRMLLGLAGGLTVLASISLGAGTQACLDFIHTLLRFGRVVSGSQVSQYEPSWSRYVDLNTFLRVAHLGGFALVGGWAIAAALVLAMFWIWSRGDTRLSWAVALTLTSVVNIYTPVYDSILVVAAAILVWSVAPSRLVGWMLALLFVSEPVSNSLAYGHQWPQIYTVVLIAFAALQVWIARGSLPLNAVTAAAPLRAAAAHS